MRAASTIIEARLQCLLSTVESKTVKDNQRCIGNHGSQYLRLWFSVSDVITADTSSPPYQNIPNILKREDSSRASRLGREG